VHEVVIGSSRLALVQGDITTLDRHVGAIVNAANEELRPGGGVCGAIHNAAGPEMVVECRWIGGIKTGQAVATTAGNLDADIVIHAVGPIWLGGGRREDRVLASAYRASLEVAEERGVKSIAFPAISTGMFGYPVHAAATVAIGTIAAYLRRTSALEDVLLVLFTPEDYQVYATTLERWQRAQESRARPSLEANDAT
jgi:O-acetyl-ADP-ribose deacetylase (regulator of RNase III)